MTTPYVRIHVEHDPRQQTVVRLCADHLRTAESCLMVDAYNVPELESTCFCPTCHFCEYRHREYPHEQRCPETHRLVLNGTCAVAWCSIHTPEAQP